MDSKIIEKLIALFWEGLSDYSNDVWFDSSSNDKERLLWWALEKLDEPIDEEEALDIFWQWADGLEEDSFIDFSDTAVHNIAEDLYGHSKGYNIIEFSDKVGWDSSARDWARALINTLDDASIRILDYYEDKNFCDFKVNQHGDIITYRVRPGGQVTIRMHEANSAEKDSFIDFNLTENQTLKALSSDDIKIEENGGRFEIYRNNKLVCTCDNMKEVKDELKDLEESTSFAADFKLYENLWD